MHFYTSRSENSKLSWRFLSYFIDSVSCPKDVDIYRFWVSLGQYGYNYFHISCCLHEIWISFCPKWYLYQSISLLCSQTIYFGKTIKFAPLGDLTLDYLGFSVLMEKLGVGDFFFFFFFNVKLQLFLLIAPK